MARSFQGAAAVEHPGRGEVGEDDLQGGPAGIGAVHHLVVPYGGGQVAGLLSGLTTTVLESALEAELTEDFPRQRLNPRIPKSRRHLRGAEIGGYAGIALGVIVIVIGLITAAVQLLN